LTVDVSIIIACFNEEGILANSVREIDNVMDQTKYTYELIFIDDCSQDRTKEVIKKLAHNLGNVKYVFHDKNVGRGGTVCEGIRMSKGKMVGYLDIDLEVHARYIPSMLSVIANDGYDISTAFRIYKIPSGPFIRHVLSVGYRKLVRYYLRTNVMDTETGFKFFNRDRILPVIDDCKNKGWFWDTEVMVLSERYGLKIKEIPCLFIRRTNKASTVNVIPDTIEYFKCLWKFKRQRNIQFHRKHINE
jgi:glycosyltransferase involved in cell wall biosynthesis